MSHSVEIAFDQIAAARDYQQAAPFILAPLTKIPTSRYLLEQLNVDTAVPAHCVRVEYFRVLLLYGLSFILNQPLNGELNPRHGIMTLHDVGKPVMHAKREKSLAFLDPEKSGLIQQLEPGSQADNRTLELQIAYLNHPKLSYLVIQMFTELGLIDPGFAALTRDMAFSHHETPSLNVERSYPRDQLRWPEISRYTFAHLADMSVGMGVENRPHRRGVVNRELQRKIFTTILNDAYLNKLVGELNLHGDLADVFWLRECMIDLLFQIQDQMGLIDPHERLSFLGHPNPKSGSRKIEPELLPGMIWGKHGEVLLRDMKGYEQKLKAGHLNDPLRAIQ